jgi:ribose 5-phosphate isomerase B
MSFVFDPSKPIAIGCDHAGFEYKTAFISWLTAKGYQVKDFGTILLILLIILILPIQPLPV